ncbi:3-oxoacyl-[acyl-carrier protein] reductase [Tamaricihabitans halophyticus]|uniref:3-oxoacyl-[acyl-carrier protein] reductase n=1 Tax=Tamaricihabitans halophyticus TaxID=1262583 RepID=A0A4R2QWM9_9PSEU|nr:SDR family oxidoreductase [Tamaricihabitans halophyticus]TCP53539.1 3-oxoacyl-[acyl-carrier protein] reductase [Tamaricihabitans halophyticus]
MTEYPVDELARAPLPLLGRRVLVTGVSRRQGIGYAIARRLASYGASVFAQHYLPHDREQDWGADDLEVVLAGIRKQLVPSARLADAHTDLAEPDAPRQLMDLAVQEFGHIDALVCNHALSGSDGPLGALSAVELDRHWAVNTRSTILLAQAFAAQHQFGRPGAVIFMTSGQDLGPMPGEVAYATAKAGLAGITTTLADQLADRGIRLNTVNPGPVDTGYLTEEMFEYVRPMFPSGRYGEPDDPARLIAWLITDEARWIVGQVINTEGGFGRWRPRGPATS